MWGMFHNRNDQILNFTKTLCKGDGPIFLDSERPKKIGPSPFLLFYCMMTLMESLGNIQEASWTEGDF